MDFELRSPLLADADALFKVVDKNRAHLRAWMPWLDGTRSAQDTRAFIDRVCQDAESGKGEHFLICIGSAIAGVIGYNAISKLNKVGVIGYWLSKEHNGCGIMTNAVQKIVKRGYTTLGLNRIEICCATMNTKSRAVPERLGFSHEGTRREAEYLYDHFVDIEVYALLKSEWELAG